VVGQHGHLRKSIARPAAYLGERQRKKQPAATSRLRIDR
jgi:hypothetical protein